MIAQDEAELAFDPQGISEKIIRQIPAC